MSINMSTGKRGPESPFLPVNPTTTSLSSGTTSSSSSQQQKPCDTRMEIPNTIKELEHLRGDKQGNKSDEDYFFEKGNEKPNEFEKCMFNYFRKLIKIKEEEKEKKAEVHTCEIEFEYENNVYLCKLTIIYSKKKDNNYELEIRTNNDCIYVKYFHSSRCLKSYIRRDSSDLECFSPYLQGKTQVDALQELKTFILSCLSDRFEIVDVAESHNIPKSIFSVVRGGKTIYQKYGFIPNDDLEDFLQVVKKYTFKNLKEKRYNTPEVIQDIINKIKTEFHKNNVNENSNVIETMKQISWIDEKINIEQNNHTTKYKNIQDLSISYKVFVCLLNRYKYGNATRNRNTIAKLDESFYIDMSGDSIFKLTFNRKLWNAYNKTVKINKIIITNNENKIIEKCPKESTTVQSSNKRRRIDNNLLSADKLLNDFNRSSNTSSSISYPYTQTSPFSNIGHTTLSSNPNVYNPNNSYFSAYTTSYSPTNTRRGGNKTHKISRKPKSKTRRSKSRY